MLGNGMSHGYDHRFIGKVVPVIVDWRYTMVSGKIRNLTTDNNKACAELSVSGLPFNDASEAKGLWLLDAAEKSLSVPH